MDFRFFPSSHRLHAPRHFERRLRHLLSYPSVPEESNAFPTAEIMIREAPFLHDLFQQLKRETRGCPPLPGDEKGPFILQAARDVCRHLPLHRGDMLCTLRRFYAKQDMLCREADMLPAALSYALFEQLEEQLLHADKRAEDDITLLRRHSCTLTLEAMHLLQRMPFETLLEHLRPVSRILQQDATYCRMDRESRHFYVQAVCRLARRFSLHETAVARCAIALTEGKEGLEKEAGYYLLEHPEILLRKLMKKKRSLSQKQKTLLFFLPFVLSSLLFAAGYIFLSLPLVLLPLGLIAFSENIRILCYRILRRLFPPRMLPRLASREIRDKRLLVVIPTLLTDEKQVFAMGRQLRSLHAATPHAHFMLLSDFADAKTPLTEEERRLTETAAAMIEALNRQEAPAYLLLHRSRTFDAGQGMFCGRERKRGALESLNMLLSGEECPDVFLYHSLPLSALNHRYDQVITLDADTFLPPGAAMKLQGALEHPLQKGRIAVIQPRMETLPSALHTRTQHLLSPLGQVDSYHSFVPNVYQDVFGAGSFSGKGIYDPVLFLKRTRHLPANRILSHDLIEGEMAISALAEDIVLYDSQPARLSGWQKRLHRWTRGDWQLLPFLKDPHLSLLSRWKIYDNLRFSLVSPCRFVLLILGGLLQQPLLIFLGIPYPFSGMLRRLCLMPATAVTQTDAIFRALYRLFISKKHLLSWVTAAQTDKGVSLPLPAILTPLFGGALLLFCSLLPGGFLPGILPGLCFLLPPLFVDFLDAKKPLHAGITKEDAQLIGTLCRDTWHFFEKNVHAHTHHLPPDNVQLNPPLGSALRTSPTNIGLYLLSVLAARELNLITTTQMIRRMMRTVQTLEQMETWQGHFYNWYDLKTLAPLPPKFVSTVDSGNLCACLLCCAQGLRRHMSPMDTAAHTLPERLDSLAGRMRFDKLYDAASSLFFIGYDAEGNHPSAGHYDMLASECRLTSYVAIMLRQVPLKHWFHLNRSVTRQGGGAALLSWGGTAFEYLMPTLLLPLFPHTLLGDGCLSAIRAQIAAAHHRPFGISESGYFAFDPDMQYQYRAFGLPALSLSGETEGQVVAPYASMLALPFFPEAALRNLRKMRKLSWYSEEGLFEAADYTPGKMEPGPHLVQSHMAHHQGMILCAACNLLTDFSLVHHFMLPAPARAYSFLLCEGKKKRPFLSKALPRPRTAPISVPYYSFPAENSLPASAHVLSGKGTAWLMDARGNGFLKNGDRLWTRFHPSSPCGPRFYLKNRQTGAFFCPQTSGNMLFETGCIRIPINAFQLSGEMRLFVLPLDGTAIADLVLKNKGTLPAKIDAVSFLEVAQGTFFEDHPHPAFRDLSVSVHPHQHNALFSRRLSANEKQPLLYHSLTGDVESFRRQGDRLLFLGRNGTLDAPEQLQRSASEMPCRTGAVIAPCLSITGRLSIRPGQTVHVQFITKEIALEADLPTRETPVSRASLSLCPVKDSMTLEFLSIRPAALPLYSRMLGALCLTPPGTAFFPAIKYLWALGLSGREPILSVFLQDADKPLIRHALNLHSLMETAGIQSVLLFLCDEKEENYFSPLQDAVHALKGTLKAGQDRIYITACSESRGLLLRPLSRLFLKSGTPLPAQLDALSFSADRPLLHLVPAARPDVPPLQYTNGFGGFTEEGDYCIFSSPPAPWHNILAGERFGTLVCENAVLHSFRDNSALHRITKTAPDVHRPEGAEEYLLLAENDTACSLLDGLAFHRPGITQYQARPFGLHSQVTVYTHPQKTFGLRTITLQAEKEFSCTLRCCLFFAPVLGRSITRAEAPFVFAVDARSEGFAFAHLEHANVFTLPPSLAHARDAGACHVPGGSCAVFEMPLHLLPHRPLSFTLLLGWAVSESEARQMAAQPESPGEIRQYIRRFWQEKLERLLLFGADEKVALFLNRWLPYQARCARLMARTGPYQPGGAFGFRDQLQDLLCCLHTDEAFARQHILLCAAHQYKEGDVQHWWHPPRTGVRTRISDDKLFLPFLTALYVEITGDKSILTEEIPFLHSPPLRPEEQDRYETPETTTFTASLLQHGLQALESVSFGPHGLPRMGSGDWNDGLNRVQGESVWLGFFLCMVYQRFAPLCDPETEKALLERRRTLLNALEQAWTGAWYLRAWYEDGTPLSGPHTQPPRIDLICQCFACLAGARREHAREAVRQALLHLYHPEDGLLQLLSPPFTPRDQAGYIGTYLPHVRENGGQYTHALPFMIIALCHLGEYEKAWQIANQALPLFHTETDEKVRRYRLEPYVLCGDIYAGENRGRGGWSWYTGSAAWLYYGYVAVLLGFEKRGDHVRLFPCPGGDTEEFSLVFRYHSATYHLTASREILFPLLDGEKLKDGWVHLADDGRTHEAFFPYRKV